MCSCSSLDISVRLLRVLYYFFSRLSDSVAQSSHQSPGLNVSCLQILEYQCCSSAKKKSVNLRKVSSFPDLLANTWISSTLGLPLIRAMNQRLTVWNSPLCDDTRRWLPMNHKLSFLSSSLLLFSFALLLSGLRAAATALFWLPPASRINSAHAQSKLTRPLRLT